MSERLQTEIDRMRTGLTEATLLHRIGRVQRASGLVLESIGPIGSIGEECALIDRHGKLRCGVEIVGFDGDRVFSMPLSRLGGTAIDDRVVGLGRPARLQVGPQMLGRVLDPQGLPFDGLPAIGSGEYVPVVRTAPEPMERASIDTPLVTGVRAIDATLTIGRGQRIGIFAGSGVGKSTLLGMLARGVEADVCIVALVGERGREVRDFLERDLGEAGRRKSVVFVATSEEPPMRRIRAIQSATAAAEYFRDQGQHVALFVDSLTRVAMAQREIGLSLGEPPSTKGYPPSVYALLPALLERAGSVQGGSITGIYTVYIEADDVNDPVGDAARSLLDGHIVLERRLAERGHYPAIDVSASISRLMPHVTSPAHQQAARIVRRHLAALAEADDLIALGAYQSGSVPEIDAALQARPAVEALLRQPTDESSDLPQTLERLQQAGVEARS